MFVVIEFGLMVIGFVPLMIGVYVFGWNEVVVLVGGNVGVFLAGYLYTSKTFKILF